MKTNPTFLILCRFLFFAFSILLTAETSFAQNDCDPISTFPWSEGFENNGTEIPPCWNHITDDSSWIWTVVPKYRGTPPNAHSGDYKARIFQNFSGFPVCTAQLITPVFDLSTVNNPVLNFWHTQNGNLFVYYKNSLDGEWILLEKFDYDVVISDWQTEMILLPNKSNHYQIAFQSLFLGGGRYEVQLDDVKIMDFVDFVDVELASIIAPKTGTNHTNNEQVKVLLKNNSCVPLTEFTLQLEFDGTIIAEETYLDTIPGLGEAEYTFNAKLDLSAEGEYQIKVTAIADNDQILDNNSKTVLVKSVTCNPITSFPWTENFEDDVSCWEHEVVVPGYYLESSCWATTANTYGFIPPAHSGSYLACLLGYTDYGKSVIAKLITPIFDLSAITNTPVLNFWYSTNGKSILKVYYKNSSNGEWIFLQSFSNETQGWRKEIIELPNTSNHYQIAFEGEVSNNVAIGLDDISILKDVHISSYSSEEFSLFPNPAQNTLIINRQNATKVAVSVYNNMGALVHSFETSETNFEINVSNYITGIYFIRLSDSNRFATKSFIKQ